MNRIRVLISIIILFLILVSASDKKKFENKDIEEFTNNLDYVFSLNKDFENTNIKDFISKLKKEIIFNDYNKIVETLLIIKSIYANKQEPIIDFFIFLYYPQYYLKIDKYVLQSEFKDYYRRLINLNQNIKNNLKNLYKNTIYYRDFNFYFLYSILFNYYKLNKEFVKYFLDNYMEKMGFPNSFNNFYDKLKNNKIRFLLKSFFIEDFYNFYFKENYNKFPPFRTLYKKKLSVEIFNYFNDLNINIYYPEYNKIISKYLEFNYRFSNTMIFKKIILSNPSIIVNFPDTFLYFIVCFNNNEINKIVETLKNKEYIINFPLVYLKQINNYFVYEAFPSVTIYIDKKYKSIFCDGYDKIIKLKGILENINYDKNFNIKYYFIPEEIYYED